MAPPKVMTRNVQLVEDLKIEGNIAFTANDKSRFFALVHEKTSTASVYQEYLKRRQSHLIFLLGSLISKMKKMLFIFMRKPLLYSNFSMKRRFLVSQWVEI